MLRSLLLVTFMLNLAPLRPADAAILPVPESEQKAWLRHVIPLPHEVQFKGKIEVPSESIVIRTPTVFNDAGKKAADDVKGLLQRGKSSKTAGKTFEIILGIVDDRGTIGNVRIAGAERLKSLPNHDQAYIIDCTDETRLYACALGEKGLYYAAQTLCQLLEPSIEKAAVSIPVVEIIDWPDMEERGLWNFPDPPTWIPWLASMKLNYGKMAATKLQTVKRDMPNHAEIDRDLMLSARAMGFNYCPYIIHLNFLHDYGLFSAYPELAGVGDSALAGRYFAHKHGNQHRAPCANNPMLVTILAEWMSDIAEQGADDISCWLTERPAQCGHPECREIGQFVLEARAFVAAWKKVRAKHPDVSIRLFISTTTDERYHKILAETPPEVKIERCCSTEMERVRMLPRDRFVNPLFDGYASEGRWMASYDVPIGAYGRVETPEFKVPSSSAHRIRDFVDQLHERRYRGAYGMIAWSNKGIETCGFNISALAEWSWNRNGRSTREFAEAWAVKNGYANPEAVGEWSELMGPVEFDVYESDIPVCYSWGKATAMIDERRFPVLGEGMFRYFVSKESFDEKLNTCRKALSIAESSSMPHLADETKVVASYISLAKAIYETAFFVAGDNPTMPENRKAIASALAALEKAGEENAKAIRTWRSALGPEPWHYRVTDAIASVETTVSDIKESVTGKYLY